MEDHPSEDDHQYPRSTEYPDPEIILEAPWWGQAHFPSAIDLDDSDIPQVSRGLIPSERQPASEPDGAYRSTVALGRSSSRGFEGLLESRLPREDDPDIDPTFEPSRDDDFSDGSMSALSQSSSGDFQPPSKPLVKRRGQLSGGRGGTCSRRDFGETIRRSQKGIKRGQRQPLEPSQEFKSLHAQATMAFIDADYDSAEDLILQAIKMNPEMYAAFSLLAEIDTARGDHDSALTALFHGAHTRPRDLQVWTTVGQLLLARAGDDDMSALTDALYCYIRIVQLDPTNIDARHQRAALNRKLGHKGRAATDYEHILELLPHDLSILRSLAEIYTEMRVAQRAIEHYDRSIKFYQAKEPDQARTVSWSDLNIYIELLADKGRYLEAISKVKSVSRWLLGRRGDVVWDDFDQDDREWDLEDHPRRVQVQGFRTGYFPDISYGKGMPLELRVKLGTLRLRAMDFQLEEALGHFVTLEPDDTSPNAKIHEYPDLFRDVAETLRRTGFYQEALIFYKPLQQISAFSDASYYADMAICFQVVGLHVEAAECYRLFLNSQASTGIRPTSSESNEAAPAEGVPNTMDCATTALGQSEAVSKCSMLEASADNNKISKFPGSVAMIIPPPLKKSLKRRGSDKRFRAKLHDESIRILYRRTQELLDRARDDDAEALVQWMAATQEIVDDFRSHRGFYPHDRGLGVYGRSTSSAVEAHTLNDHQITRDSIPIKLTYGVDRLNTGHVVIAGDHRGIPFASWLDLMLEYAMLLARSENIDKAYEILNIANDANVFYCCPESMFLIHVCWFGKKSVPSRQVAHDERTLCNVARWFMKEFQFVTDGYRLFSAVNRLCDGRNRWFNCGASQKFVLRQLKALDSSLGGQGRQSNLDSDRVPLVTGEETHGLDGAAEMDLALLMLYGYILYVGKSYSLALNYFYRAFALDPSNPMINLSLALAYIQHAIKRQSDDRHQLITQGLTFLLEYYDLRCRSRSTSEQQEAKFNVARTYHMLGLTHLAIPYYQGCLALSPNPQSTGPSQGNDFSMEAAFALRNIWVGNEEIGDAVDVTYKYLVI
ncbi:MAG: hypothetical protein Q9181_000623 [Wetmoreana brouardii]